jgi:ubiquinone/menaquinone biosynthesis C-methylase UbiE
MSEAWFQKAFGPEYSDLYAHRDSRDAERAMGLIRGLDEIDLPNMRVLDLCCGEGRHSFQALRWNPRLVVGMDLSPWLLKTAARVKRDTRQALHIVRGDMRSLPFRSASFDLVLNLFTSFGYFHEEEQNEGVFRELRRVLVASGGYFVIDHVNPAWLEKNLVPESERFTPRGARVHEWRRIVGESPFRRVEKRAMVEFGKERREFLESVRLYEPSEMTTMAARWGLVLHRSFGDFDAGPLGPDSPRAIYVFSTS